MKKTKKTKETKEFLSNLWYYVSEAFTFTVVLLLGMVAITVGFMAAVFLAAAPMFYWSPWWGLLSIPLTLTLVVSIIMWRVDA